MPATPLFLSLFLLLQSTTRLCIAVKPSRDHGFQILSEELLYKNWRTVTRRTVRLPTSKRTADFEIVGQKGSDQAVLVFVWNSRQKSATLIQEYMPALHMQVTGLAAGMVEDDKHDSSILTAAQHELEEECYLTGGTWTLLCQPTYMDKYSSTRLSVFLCVDPTPIPPLEAKPRDETEEGIQVLENVSVAQIREAVRDGHMTIVGGWAAQLALQRLQEDGMIE